MTAYNFAAQFADAVESGEKKQTIRAPRKNGHAKVGDKLQLYTGMRTKQCRKLRDAVCASVDSIEIQLDRILIERRQNPVAIESYGLCFLNEFAHDDGFGSWESMRNFFDKQYGLPFSGVLIKWG